MRPDDVALDYPCETCKARVGEPCTMVVCPRQGLMERAVPHLVRRASAVAMSGSSGGRNLNRPRDSVDADGPGIGAAEGSSNRPTDIVPTFDEEVDGTISRAEDVPAARGAPLPVIELQCGHPASDSQAIKALNQPDAPDLFCFICAKHVERAS